MKDPDREDSIRSFFQTHTGEMVVVPGVAPDQLPAKIRELLPKLMESNIVDKLFQVDGLKQEKTSWFALLDCLFTFRCDGCNSIPVIFEGAVFSKNGATYFTEGGHVATIPATGRILAIQKGYHFLLNGHCAPCDRSRYVIASHHPEFVPIINSFALEALGLECPEAHGFIALPSWIDTYFTKKKFDRKFAQQTVIRLTETLFTLLKSAQERQLPRKLGIKERSDNIKMDLKRLLPQVMDEIQFCGFIKGVFHFYLIYVLFSRNRIAALDPKLEKLHISQVIKQAKEQAPLLSPGKKVECFVVSLVLIAETYRKLTNSELPLPQWIQPFCDKHLKRFFHPKGDST
ncbi:MAG: hypothetical protein ACFFFG_17720 [Candidatus Thorarchaeota archaeon]